jgi:peptidyl-prolyl cis-trans isomerase B (cyclophilin B)
MWPGASFWGCDQPQAVETGGKALGQQHRRHEQGPAGGCLAELRGQQGQDGLRGVDRRVDGDGGDEDEGDVAQEHRVFMPAFYAACNFFFAPPRKGRGLTCPSGSVSNRTCISAARESERRANPWQQSSGGPPRRCRFDAGKNYRVTLETDKRRDSYSSFTPRTPPDGQQFRLLGPGGLLRRRRVPPRDRRLRHPGRRPHGHGRGGPGYSFEDECKGNPLKHGTGLISMANAGPHTTAASSSSPTRPSPTWTAGTPCSGKVVEGWTWSTAIRQGDKMVKLAVVEG